jgi:hypothetical protein
MAVIGAENATAMKRTPTSPIAFGFRRSTPPAETSSAGLSEVADAIENSLQ